MCAKSGGSRFLQNVIFYHSTQRHIRDDSNFSSSSYWCFSFMSSRYLFHVSFSDRLSWPQNVAHNLTWISYTLLFVLEISHTQYLHILFKLLVWSPLYLRLAMRVYVIWSPRLRHLYSVLHTTVRIYVYKTFILGYWLSALTLRWLMSYIYGAPILDVSRSHTTTQHSR